MTTYQPTGTGLCKVCGHDVGEHDDPAHRFDPDPFGDTAHLCSWSPVTRYWCSEPEDHPIHDVGRTLRCPKEDTP